jgi:signal transduction histidine kinase
LAFNSDFVEWIAPADPPTLMDSAVSFDKPSTALRTASEHYHALFDAMDDGVCVIEVLFDAGGVACDYRFLQVNPAFVAHTGLKDAVGKTICELVPAHESYWCEVYGRVALSGQPARFVDEAKALGRWYDVYAVRVGDAARRQVALLFRDITGRKLADARLRHLAEEQAEADRSKSAFLATLAHELRNPLAPLQHCLQLMRLPNCTPAKRARMLGIMERQLTQLAHLVDDVFDLSRMARAKIVLRKSRADIRDIVAGAVETSAPVIDAKQHRLSVAVPPHPLYLDVDRTRLTQVISNLLINAAKYTPAGGRIWLAARRHHDELILSVTDTGIGIAADKLKAVFELFTQLDENTDQAKSGLGIGLSLVRKLIELHGGTVAAASAGLGRGSTFTVRLPLSGSA